MPLTRDGSGRLGVVAHGAGQSSGSVQSVHTTGDVRVFVDQDGNWQAKVISLSSQVSDKKTAAAFKQYSRDRHNLNQGGENLP
ncbi:hypothetical protein D3C87_1967910 [compost metagenome]